MKKYVDYEKMSEEQFATLMARRAYWYGNDGFWHKLLCVLWALLVVLTALEIAGIAPATSTNAYWAGWLGIVAMPIIGAIDYHRFVKNW